MSRACCSAVALALALAVGALLAGVPTQLGLWRWLTTLDPSLVGLAPAFHVGVPYKYTFERLAAVDLIGQTAIVTGANSGIGYYTALHLARQGAHVILACRTPSKCAAAAAAIERNTSRVGSVEARTLDTSSVQSARAFALDYLRAHDSLDMLVLNAGTILVGAREVVLTPEGIEGVFATNHVGHAALYRALLPALRRGGATGTARVVSVSSALHYQAPPHGVALSREQLNAPNQDPDLLYAQSKLAQLLYMMEDASRTRAGVGRAAAGELVGGEDGRGAGRVLFNACHPGVVDTPIQSQMALLVGEGLLGQLTTAFITHVLKPLFWTAEEGALTQLFLAAAPEVAAHGLSGAYFHPQAQPAVPCPRFATNLTLRRAVWEFTNALIDAVPPADHYDDK